MHLCVLTDIVKYSMYSVITALRRTVKHTLRTRGHVKNLKA